MNLLKPILLDIMTGTSMDDLRSKTCLREFCAWLDEQIKLIPQSASNGSAFKGLALSPGQRVRLHHCIDYKQLQLERKHYDEVGGVGVVDDLETACLEVFQSPLALDSAEQIMGDAPPSPEGTTINSASVAGDQIYKVIRALISSRYIDYAKTHDEPETFFDFPYYSTPVAHQMEQQNKDDALAALAEANLSDAAIDNLMTIASWDWHSGQQEIFCKWIKDFYLVDGKLDDIDSMINLGARLGNQLSLEYYGSAIQNQIVPRLNELQIGSIDFKILSTYLKLLCLTNKADSLITIDQSTLDKLVEIITEYQDALTDDFSREEDCILNAIGLILDSNLETNLDTTGLERVITNLIKVYYDGCGEEKDLFSETEKNFGYCFALLYKIPSLSDDTKMKLQSIIDAYNFEPGFKTTLVAAARGLLDVKDGKYNFDINSEITGLGTGDTRHDIETLIRLSLVYQRDESKNLFTTLNSSKDGLDTVFVPLTHLSLLFADLAKLDQPSKTRLEKTLISNMIDMYKRYELVTPGMTEEDYEYDPIREEFYSQLIKVVPKKVLDAVLDHFFDHELAQYEGTYREFSSSMAWIANDEFDIYLKQAGKIQSLESRLDHKYPGWRGHTQEYITDRIRNY